MDKLNHKKTKKINPKNELDPKKDLQLLTGVNVLKALIIAKEGEK